MNYTYKYTYNKLIRTYTEYNDNLDHAQRESRMKHSDSNLGFEMYALIDTKVSFSKSET